MAVNTRQRLVQYLGELKEEELKTFRLLLKNYLLGKEFLKKKHQNQLEKAGHTKMASIIVNIFDDQRVWDVVMRIWEKMELKELCERAKAEDPLMGNRRKYINRMREKFSLTWDGSSCLKNLGDLHKEFTPLLLLCKSREPENIPMENKHNSVMTKQAHIIDITALFGPDKKHVPQTVVLHGAPGIGKTILTRKIMLDWAQGDLFQDRFQNVFYLNCRTLNLMLEMSLADLISKDWPDFQVPIEAIMSKPKALLFIIDGFEELKWPFEEPKSELCHHWEEKHPVPILLGSLLRKTIFPKSSLLITTRPSAMGMLKFLPDNPHCVEILGFTEANIETYISKFFKTEAKVLKALSVIKANDSLLNMCSVPLECWIVCTCLKQHMEREEPMLIPQTTTALYVSYLSFGLSNDGSYPSQHHDTQLKGLCSLAAEEFWGGKSTFDGDDLKRHGLDVSDDSAFLGMYILEKKNDYKNCYSFIHRRFLEFFAAMFYVLEEEKERRDDPIFGRDIKELLKQYREYGTEVSIVRFLFGLLNEKTVRELERNFICPMSERVKAELLQWMIVESNTQRTMNPLLYSDPLKMFHCLYEIQKEALVKQAMEYFPRIRLSLHTQKDVLVSIFCIKLCCSVERMWLHVSQTLALMYSSPLILSQWQELISILSNKQSLKELEISGSFLDDRSMKILYKELRHPNCKLQTLRLPLAELSKDMKKELEALLKIKPSIKNIETIPDVDMKKEKRHNSPQEHQRSRTGEGAPQTKPEVTSSLPNFDPLKDEQLDLERCHNKFLGPNGPINLELTDKNRNIYRVHLPTAGFYHWPDTGLGFSVKSEVTVDIEFGTWNRHLDWTQKQSWMIAGPLFHIRVDPEVVTSVHLPHFVYLQGGKFDVSLFKIAHFKEEGMVLENPTRVESSHAILENPSFSTMGVLLRIMHSTFKFIPIYSTTLVYCHLRAEDITLHLYLIPSDCTIRKAIDEEEAKFHFLRLHKPSPVTPLYIGSRFLVSGSKHLEIMPAELELCYQSAGECQFFSEIYSSNVKEKISLDLRHPNGTLVWETLVRSGDLGLACAPVSSGPTGLHFVDQHRDQIISRVTAVDMILDKLYSQFLSNEEYEHIRAEKTNPDKMRRLFSFSTSWDRNYRDHLYEILKETHPHLINEIQNTDKAVVKKPLGANNIAISPYKLN
ncbi:NACHT, LRR and PYD domains-containing protein 1 [Phascolarctos cinereus]|uniref:NACHT, LRR and PYD domains-containing protein 1 n=1 Tax=Phascolarctos cinereus TaxID=38626 RepID=A0A6P5JKG6_PHACI|nr:NACHT, LRR and PYD domains-containing protein 1 [Phascolarctos cinereus]